MTTGSRVIGSTKTAYYSFRSWNGGDRTPSPPVVSSRKVTYFKRVKGLKFEVSSKFPQGRLVKTTYVEPHTRVKYFKVPQNKRDNRAAHAYACTAGVGFQNVEGARAALPVALSMLPAMPPSFSANEIVAIQNRLARKIKTHSFNLAVSAGQLGLTTTLMIQTVQRVSAAIMAIRHGRLADAARVLGASPRRGAIGRVRNIRIEDVSDAWLELQYGWKPLLGDAHDSAEALAYIMDPPRRAKISVTMRGHSSTGTVMANTNPLLNTVTIFYERYTSRRMVVELVEELSVARSLGMTDPLSVAWELLPLSFVADWFVPFGAYLENLAVLPFVTGNTVTTEKRVRKMQFSGGQGYGGYYLGSNGSYHELKIDRTLSYLDSPQTPRFELPYEADSNLLHFGNAVALLTSIVTSKT